MISRLKDVGFGTLTELSAPRDSSDTIIVAGSSRSGTTWLAELLRSLDGYKFLNEPLHLGWFPEAKKAGFGWRTHIAPDEEARWAKTYLRRALTGRLRNRTGWKFEASTIGGKVYEHVVNRKVVVKFCRAHRLLHWMDSHFQVRGIVFLIRHPCAVLASMLKHGAWENVTLPESGDPRDLAAIRSLPEVVQRDVLRRLPSVETRKEALIATWCVDHYISLHYHADGNYPWVMTTYEHLLSDCETEIVAILDALNRDVPPSMEQRHGTPSSSASDTLKSETKAQLSKWKNQLAAETIDKILDMAHSFGIQLYDDRLFPCRARTAAQGISGN